MNGGVRIRTEAGDDGRTRIVELAATAPLGAKVTGPARSTSSARPPRRSMATS